MVHFELNGFLKTHADAPPPGRAPELQNLYLRLTGRCNLSCPHCYVSSPSPQDLPAPLIFKLLDQLYEQGGRSITLSGGEPLLYPNLRDILEYAAQRVSVEILSNGTLLDQEWAITLSRLGNVSVQLSFDGATRQVHDAIRGKGHHDRVLRAISHLQKAGMGDRITLSTTVMNQNLASLGEIIEQAQALGIPRARFLPLRRVGRALNRWDAVGQDLTLKDYEQFFDAVLALRDARQVEVDISCGLSGFLFQMPEEAAQDDMWCPVGHKLVVEVDGWVYPCVLMMQERFRLGNVFHDSISTLLHSPKMTEVCHSLAARRTTIPRCASCLWRNFCQAGCMGQALDEQGTIEATDSFCNYRQRAYGEAFKRLLDDARDK